MSEKIVQLNEEVIKGQLKELVRGSVEETLNGLLEAGYRQVLCANSFTSLAELSLHRAGKPALNYLAAEYSERVKATTRRKLFAIR